MIRITWNDIWQILAFLGIQYTLGRRGSFPYGLLVKWSLVKITVLVVISDIILTIILLNVLEYSFSKIKLPAKIRNWLDKRKEKSAGKERGEKYKKFGPWGVLLIAALPYAGGALSGSILACSMKMNKKKAFFLIIIGSTLGTIIFYLGFFGIVSALKIG